MAEAQARHGWFENAPVEHDDGRVVLPRGRQPVQHSPDLGIREADGGLSPAPFQSGHTDALCSSR